MQKFEIKVYRATEGLTVREMHAESAADAEDQCRRDGFKVVAISGAAGASSLSLPTLFGPRQKFPLVLFTTELLSLLQAGLNIIESLDVLSVRGVASKQGQILLDIRRRLAEGLPLSRVIEQLPNCFPPLYVASVRASERTGNLTEALSRYLSYRQQMDTLKKKLIGVAIYPSIIVATGLLVMLFLLGYVVPKFSQIYADLGDKLPSGTKWLIWWGNLVSQHGGWLLAGFVLLITASTAWLVHPKTRASFIQLLWGLPWIGERFRLYQLARFYRTLSMLQRAGIPFVQSLDMAASLLPQAALAEGLNQARGQIAEGQPIAATFKAQGLTDEVSFRLIGVGEKNGNLGEMMERIANFYDEELGKWVDIVSRMFEPILMAIVGAMIGSIVLMMYLPIFELAGSLQ